MSIQLTTSNKPAPFASLSCFDILPHSNNKYPRASYRSEAPHARTPHPQVEEHLLSRSTHIAGKVIREYSQYWHCAAGFVAYKFVVPIDWSVVPLLEIQHFLSKSDSRIQFSLHVTLTRSCLRWVSSLFTALSIVCSACELGEKHSTTFKK